jgi:hypothetical protein
MENKTKPNLPAADLPVPGDSPGVPASPPENKSSKKKLRLWLTVGVFLALMAIVGIFIFRKLGSLYGWPHPGDRLVYDEEYLSRQISLSGVVTYLQGEVFTFTDGRRTELRQDDVVSEGDTIETREDSRVVLMLDDGSVVRLGENTTIVLGSLIAERIEIENQIGSVYSRVDKDDQHIFQVRAGGVKVESLGTAFNVDYSGGEDVTVMVFDSEVKVVEEEEEEVVEEGHQWEKEKKKKEEIDPEKVQKNEFLAWNFDEDKKEKHEVKYGEVKPTPTSKSEPTPEPDPVETPAPVQGGIVLEGAAQMDGIRLSWSLNGVEAPNGFKVVKNTQGNPSYPGDAAVYQSAGTKQYVWKLTNGETYRFRVCKYEDGACQVYSNEVTVTAPKVDTPKNESTSSVTGISAQVQNLGGGQAKVSWTTEGGTPSGFKVCWSTSPDPVYPPRSGDEAQYVGGHLQETTISGLSGTYHFRVCHYKSGCQLYTSNMTLGF